MRYFEDGYRVRLTKDLPHDVHPLQAGDVGTVLCTPDQLTWVEFDRYPGLWVSTRTLPDGRSKHVLTACERANPAPTQLDLFKSSVDDRTYDS